MAQGRLDHGPPIAVIDIGSNSVRLVVYEGLTRSLTPPLRPASLRQLADIACDLRARVELPSRTRYRLVGVGLSGFVDPDSAAAQDDLFAAAED